jgi:hypothetical protein
MRQFCFFVLLLFITGNVFAFDSFFIGLGAEANANTREGMAAGGGLSFGADLNRQFALGIKAAYSNNFDTLGNIESAAFFRWYPLSGLFIQAEAGGAFFFEDSETYPAFLGGITAGWRFALGGNFYLEPAVRVGYPFAWGTGVSVVMQVKNDSSEE